MTGPDRGARLTLGADSMRLGSASDCELVLHDPTVSARHAEISVQRSGYVIRDLGSRNQIRLAGWPIERAPLTDRMRISLGETTLVVRALGTSHSIALSQPGQVGDLIAYSVKMRAVAATILRLAASDLSVLIEGETGTGKEVAAHALHASGPRAAGPFVILDCGAVARNLMSDELFGHERGAFSGADQRRLGLLDQADGGTLFIDEIGELPLDIQATLIRAVEARASRRIGGSAAIERDIRVVATTNRNLEEEVRRGRFRQDLYFRLAGARVRLPPLRERMEDIPILAQTFAAGLGISLPPELVDALLGHPWPGNVRELRHTIERVAIAMSGDDGGVTAAIAALVATADPQRAADRIRPLGEARRLAGERFERAYLEVALKEAGGNLSRAAELAGVSRQVMTQLAAKHGLRARDRRPG